MHALKSWAFARRKPLVWLRASWQPKKRETRVRHVVHRAHEMRANQAKNSPSVGTP